MLPHIMATNEAPSETASEAQYDKANRYDLRMARDTIGFETTADGDVLVVQPSFDDVPPRSKTPTISHQKSADWQARSPNGDGKQSDEEERNPSSPPVQNPRHSGHVRSLSGRFFESTTISDEVSASDRSKDVDTDMSGRKHRRMFSGDATNPNNAHRRINSIGHVASVSRRHHREGSGGLDILSAVAHSTKEELAAAGGAASWEMSRRSPYHPPPHVRSVHPSRAYEGMVPGYGPPHGAGQPMVHHSMNPPPQRRMHYAPPSHAQYPPQYNPSSAYHPYPPPPQSSYYPPQHQHRSAYSPPRGRYMPSYPPHHPEDPAQKAVYDNPPPPPRLDDPVLSGRPAFDRRTSTPPSTWAVEGPPSSAHQGSQTFVTSIAVGNGNKMVQATTNSRSVATNTDEIPLANKPPSEVGHHRKMSSFSSIGTLGLFPSGHRDTPPVETEVAKKGHHRSTSSSVSFLHGIDVGLEINNNDFLRNVRAFNESGVTVSSPVPALAPYNTEDSARPSSVTSTTSRSDTGSLSGTKLAAGGTSKRVRRKCTIEGCTNRVVQGGLCISHGAKRKICNHPGCNKNVKKAGLCSTHGPARKRCEHPGCPKVAVQGGRCISHGAKKKLCAVEDCTKQAILAGMCKKHHDQAMADGQCKDTEQYCQPAREHKPTHTRGLSFFQEISPDAISTLLNSDKGSEQEERVVW